PRLAPAARGCAPLMTHGPLLLFAMTWIVAFNLRAGLMGLGPILPGLTLDLGLSHVQASVLVAIPTAMMGLGALPGGWLADRWGASRLIVVGLALAALGGALRAMAGAFPPLVMMTILFGAGIGLTQPSLPRLTRHWFPGRLGLATGIYASGLVAGATVAVAITAPLLLPLTADESWRPPLLIWGGVALLAALAWVVVMRPWQPDSAAAGAHGAAINDPPADAWSPWRERGLWVVALICGGQGLAYYLMISWLPTIYSEQGVSLTRAGLLVGAFNLASLPSIIAFPAIADALGSRRLVALVASGLVLGGGLGLAVAPTATGWEWLWGPLAGAGVSGLFGLSLMMPAELAPSGRTGAAAGMVLGIGFAISALGPVLAGGLRDLTGSFQTATMVLPITGAGLIAISLLLPDLPPRPRAIQPAPSIGQPKEA
ncbi:MAG: MFS transporter, partial [Chloroflexota bacterium]|nr:MFS transporter [Chloroflexota bacterium]